MNPEISDRNPLYPKSISYLDLLYFKPINNLASSTIGRGEPIIVTDWRFGSNRVVFHAEPSEMDGRIKMLVVHQDLTKNGFVYTPSVDCLSVMGIIPYAERWDDAHFCIKDTAEERQALLDYIASNPNLGWNSDQIRKDIMNMDKL